MAKTTTRAAKRTATPSKRKTASKATGARKAAKPQTTASKAKANSKATASTKARATTKATATKARASSKAKATKAKGTAKVTKSTAKKTTARATASRAKATATTRTNGLDKFLQEQLAVLDEERASYLRQAETLQAEADSLTEDREPGDVQFDEESGEGDTLAVERERDLALSAQARLAIEEIDRAVEKIHEGTYGNCDNCGKAIPKERLKALPYAALCVRCKSGGLGLSR